MPTSRRHEYDSGYQLGSFHDARSFSNAVLDDSYDLQAQSRGRDRRLMSQMNSALHTDRPPTSPLLSNRSSKPRNISQLQHKTHRSTRLDTTGTDTFKSTKLPGSVKTSTTSDSYKPSKPQSSSKSSRPLASLKLSKLSDSFKLSKPYEPLTLPKEPEPRKPSKPLSKSSDYVRKNKSSDSLKFPKPTDSSKPAASLQLMKMPGPTKTKKLSGLDKMPPVVEQARSLLNRHRTFGINPDLDKIAHSAITSPPRDLKKDFFSVSPLTNYIKTRWPQYESDDDVDLTSPITSPITIEAPATTRKELYKNPYLDSEDEEFEVKVEFKPKKKGKPGDVLKSLRKKRSSEYTADDSDLEDDSAQGAYAISKYTDDDEDEERVVEKPRRSKKYEIEESSSEVALSHLVSAAALRARAVLENLTGIIGKGGLVNVEGDIKPYGGSVTTFRLHAPFHFQGPMMIGEKPALSIGDDSFERYIFGLQEKRREERENVEKDAKRMTKLTRSLGQEAPKLYSLKPIGYINDGSYDSFSKSLVPLKTKFDRTIISPSSKKVHFDEADDEVKRPTVKLSRELIPFVPKGLDADEMAVVPKRKRFPVYEYTEDIPMKMSIAIPGDDGTERLSVLEKIRIKALLVGDDKLDEPGRPRPRKPRTRYYADKLRQMEDKEQLSSIMATPHTHTVKASKPPVNYRLESRLEPDDLIHKPSTYGKMRDQVRDVQDKLDRHRQLLDRHAGRVVGDTGLADSYGSGGSLSAGRTTEEGGAADGAGKVSPLRKKLRKVICKARHNPSYYED